MKNKILLGLTSIAVVAVPVATVISCGSEGSNKPTFYNYEDYMEDSIIDNINEKFSYSTFGDLPQFEDEIRQKTTAGGIGSDYLNAKLAKEGLLAEIDFAKVFPDEITSTMTTEQIEEKLKEIYTPETWQLMSGFDVYISDTNNNLVIDESETQKHLYNYMIPYFIQNKVVAFDLNHDMVGQTTGKRWSEDDYAKLVSGNGEQINSVFNNDLNNDQNGVVVSYSEIFSTLKDHGYTNLEINDYWRDNMMIGSEASLSGFKSSFSSEAEAKDQINGFAKVVESFGNVDSFRFVSSGAETLEDLISPRGQTDVATLYNGDALDAYYGEDNVDGPQSIGVVKPTNSSYLLDGMVIPKDIADNHSDILEDVYQVLRDDVYAGATDDTSNNESLADTQIWKNFDFVNYTTPFRNLFNNLKSNSTDDYFTIENEDGTSTPDKMAEYISIGMIEGQVDANHVTQPVSKALQDKALNAYIDKFPGSTQG